MLATLVHRSPRNWDLYLPLLTHAYNTSFHHSIKNTPFFLMFGRDAIPHIYGNSDDATMKSSDLKHRLEMLKTARQVVSRHLMSEQSRSMAVYYEAARPVSYESNDVVMLKAVMPPSAQVRKLYPRFVGPYRVKSVRNHILGVVPLLSPQGQPRYIHSDRAIHCPNDVVLDQSMEELLSPFDMAAAIDPNLEMESPE
jgi:hypothetical protein